MKHSLLLLAMTAACTAGAQTDTILLLRDTVQYIARDIEPVIINAYGYNRTLRQTPASVTAIGPDQLGRYSNTSVLQAINATPGARMEERSPGSYRLNVRGSTLRSPFGVRNVKIYYNDIPLTDPSGFSYFNQLGFYNIASLQLIKGPGSSLYGGGTGGVMLVNSLAADTGAHARVTLQAGSYGLMSVAGEAQIATAAGRHVIRVQHQDCEGYRVQAAMKRNTVSWDGIMAQQGRAELRATFLYNELSYQTPGALTLSEFENDPTAARPRTAAAAGAVESNAEVMQKNLLAGFTAAYQLTPSLRNTTTLYGSYTMLTNPTIRNYSRTAEPHYGGRTVFRYYRDMNEAKLQVLAGGELQDGYVYARTYSNINGTTGFLQSDDEVNSRQAAGFVQATLSKGKWMPELGLSVNKYGTAIKRLMMPQAVYDRRYDLNVAPRLAISYNLAREYYTYINVAKGFSPPTSAELQPTGSAANLSLNPETGWSYEAGSKGNISPHLSYDVCLFYFQLTNTIVLRKNAAGGDEYVNGGATQQAGIEGNISYRSYNAARQYIWVRNAWLSYTGYDFRYRNFVQLSTDYSGMHLPGVAPHTLAAGLDVSSVPGIDLNLTWYFSDKLPLNDMNSAYAAAYHVLDARLSYARTAGRFSGRLFVGVNNLLNEQYSLGNDINAAGARYYNAAPGINYYAGLVLECHKPRG